MGTSLLALRLAWRGLLAGEYRVLVTALLLAVSCATLLGVLSDRLQGAVDGQSASLAGGHLVIRSNRPVDAALTDDLTLQGVGWSQRVELNTMAGYQDDFVLINLKAVDAAYPLLGQVRIETITGEILQVRTPPVGEIWIEPSLALRLGIALGEWLEVGDQSFRVSALLLETPDQSGGFASFSPTALVHLDSLQDSALLSQLSRARWRLGMTAPDALLDELRASLPERLTEGQRLIDGHEDSPAVARLVQEGRQYLSMAGLIAILLASLAVALAAQRQARRQTREFALLRCLGQSRQRVMTLFLWQLFWLGLAAGVLGGLLGYLAHLGLVALLLPLLPLTLPPADWWPLLTSIGLSLWLLLGFSLAPLLRLAQVSPLAVFQDLPRPLTASVGLTYGLALLAIIGTGYWLSGNLPLTLWTLLGLFAVGLLVVGLGWLVLRLIAAYLPRLPWTWRQGLRRLQRYPAETLLQLATFTLVFTAILLVARGGQQLLNQWQLSLPEDRPDHFAIDIQSWQQQDFARLLQDYGLSTDYLYPVIRARLTQINGQPAIQQVPAANRDDNTLRRELNLTWAASLPEANELLQGHWWQPDAAGQQPLPVSVELEVAERLGLSLGDELRFEQAGSDPVLARVASLRSVNWDSFTPNFFFIFPPESLQHLPHTWLASFVMPADESAFMQRAHESFPGVALLDIRALLAQVDRLLQQLSLGIQYVLGFVLLAGLLVAWALMLASLDARQREMALLKVFGVSQSRLRQRQWMEFCLLGGLAGLLASLLGEALYALLAWKLFNLGWQPVPWLWLLPPLAGAALLVGFSRLALARTLQTEPHRLLKALS